MELGVYEQRSVIARTLKLLLPDVDDTNLTLRDKQANTFEANLVGQQPRADKIDLGAGANEEPPTAAQLAQPINDHLKAQVQQAAMMEQTLPPAQRSGTDPKTITTEEQASAYLQSVYAKLHS